MAKLKPSVSALFDKLMDQSDRLPIPQLADISAAFIHEMGGIGAIAKVMASEFLAAKAGSLTRAKILDPVLRGLRREQEMPPIANLDDARLKKLLASTMKEWESMEEGDGETAGPAPEHAAAGPEPAEAAEAEGAVPVHARVEPPKEA